MKSIFNLLSYAFLMFLLVSGKLTLSQSLSVQGEHRTQLATALENKLTQVLRSYDSKAFVVVHLEQAQTELNLPLTPFIAKTEIPLSEASLTAQVHLYSSLEVIPPEAISFAESIL